MKTKLIILYIVIFSFNLLAENQYFSISGKIYFKYEKPIHIFLVDAETSKKPFVGINSQVIIPNKEDITNGYISYQFNTVKTDSYGIRCFQDLNDNKKLDKGLFGPSEPWGLSWNENKTSDWPSFKNFCFKLSKDKNNVDIKLKN